MRQPHAIAGSSTCLSRVSAGTLYTTVTGGTPVVGASITVKDAANKTFDLVTMQNGNFYTSQSVTFPVTVFASQCPDAKPMVSAVQANGGGCNMAGCHAAASTTGRVYLP